MIEIEITRHCLLPSYYNAAIRNYKRFFFSGKKYNSHACLCVQSEKRGY